MGPVRRVFAHSPMMLALRNGLPNVLLLAAIGATARGGWAVPVLGLAIVLIGAPVDELVGDEVARIGSRGRLFHDTNLYATLPLLLMLTTVYMRAVASSDPFDLPTMLGTATLVGYCQAAFGATVGHELTHRTDSRAAYISARLLFALTFNSAFPTFHLYIHHRAVATERDPATARRGEYALSFVARTMWGQLVEAWRCESARARRHGALSFGPRNRVVSGQMYTLGFVGAAGLIAGPIGILAFICAGSIGCLVHELVNYVQHFGLVRVQGAPVEARHAWDCHRVICNALHYNLPKHADHHLAASKPFWRLRAPAEAAMLTYGYQTMVALALVPGLWKRTMAPLLAYWDARLASEAERALLGQSRSACVTSSTGRAQCAE
jgi:fatty acid desaturase